MSSRAINKALGAMSDLRHIKPSGVVYTHDDYPGEHFLPAKNPVTGQLWEGAYHKDNGCFYWQVWVWSADRHSEIPFPARAEKLKSLPLN